MADNPFDPDWTLAPAALLREWLQEAGVTKGALARRCGCGEADIKALLLIEEVLERRPLGVPHAEMLERGTGVTAAWWLGAEQTYRADLAAGRRDVTPED